MQPTDQADREALPPPDRDLAEDMQTLATCVRKAAAASGSIHHQWWRLELATLAEEALPVAVRRALAAEQEVASQRAALLACHALLERLSAWVDPDSPTPFWASGDGGASPREEIAGVLAKVREVLHGSR